MRKRMIEVAALAAIAMAPAYAGAQFFVGIHTRGFHLAFGSAPVYVYPGYYYDPYPVYYVHRPRRFFLRHRWRHDRGRHLGWYKHGY